MPLVYCVVVGNVQVYRVAPKNTNFIETQSKFLQKPSETEVLESISWRSCSNSLSAVP